MKLEIKDASGRPIQTVDLPDGEYTLAVTSAQNVNLTPQSASFRLSQIGGVFLLLLFTVALFCIDQYIETAPLNPEDVVVFKNAMEMFVSILGMAGLLSLISRALTHKFQIWNCLNFILVSYLGYFFWANNMIGLRWLLPRIFWIKEVYNLVFLGWMAFVLWNLMKILLIQMNLTWRKVIVSLVVTVIVIYNAINFLPFRREYRYYRINTPPPRPSLLESSPVTVEEFLNEISND